MPPAMVFSFRAVGQHCPAATAAVDGRQIASDFDYFIFSKSRE